LGIAEGDLRRVPELPHILGRWAAFAYPERCKAESPIDCFPSNECRRHPSSSVKGADRMTNLIEIERAIAQ
jgi:hypothetical protein